MPTLPRAPAPPPDGPRLRLWTPPADEPLTEERPAAAPASPSGLSAELSLCEFFERWYLPTLLVNRKDAAPTTIRLYREALAWWARLTGDPPLRDVDDELAAAFQAGLRTATYRRGLAGRERTLSPASQRKIILTVTWVLYRAGPTLSPKRRGQALIPMAPEFEAPRPEHCPRPAFGLAEARRLYAESLGAPPAERWPARLLLWFHTGLRCWTACAVRREQLERTPAGWVLRVEGAQNRKTHKGVRLSLPEPVGERLAALPPGELAGWSRSRDYLADRHAALQRAAGLDPPLSPQAWRRTHGRQMALLGAGLAEGLAQAALQHADPRTTRAHYVDVLDELRRRLPLLWEEAGDTLSAER